MPGVYAEALAEARRHISDAPDTLLNVAFSWSDRADPPPEPEPEPASSGKRGTVSRKTRRRDSIGEDLLAEMCIMRQEVENASSGTACHDLAKRLLRYLGGGDGGATRRRPSAKAKDLKASDDEFLDGVKESIGGKNCCVRISAASHSFLLLFVGDQVESIEAWAGLANASSEAGQVFSLDDCVTDNFTGPTREDALEAISNLLAKNNRVRNDAFDKFSRAGRQRDYWDARDLTGLEVQITNLASLAAFTLDVQALLERASAWIKFMHRHKVEIDGFVAANTQIRPRKVAKVVEGQSP